MKEVSGDSAERMTEIEVRYMLQQELLRQLSDVLIQHGHELDALRRELALLRGRQNEAPNPTSVEEKPPHY